MAKQPPVKKGYLMLKTNNPTHQRVSPAPPAKKVTHTSATIEPAGYNVKKDTVGLHQNPHRNRTDQELSSYAAGARNYKYNNSKDSNKVANADRDIKSIDQVRDYREYLKGKKK